MNHCNILLVKDLESDLDYDDFSELSSDEEYFDFSDGIGEGSSDSYSDEDDFISVQKLKTDYYLEILSQNNEHNFFDQFKVSRNVVENLSKQFENSGYHKHYSGQYGKIPPMKQILIFLRFAGHQTSSFRDIANRFNISLSSLHRVIRRVSLFVSNLSSQIITWPTEKEKISIEEHFKKNGFPGVIGALGVNHIKISKPEYNADYYKNSNGYHSVQVQVVCDNRKKIVDIFVGHPGSVDSSIIYRKSPLSSELDQKCGSFYILGDSSYPLKKNLLTPYVGDLNQYQLNYNLKLSQNRQVVLNCFESLKQRFRQLYHIKLRDIVYVVHFIRACCVLYNIVLDNCFDMIENSLSGRNVVNNSSNDDNKLKEEADRIRDSIAIKMN